jgi:hypothetical protein
MQALLKEKLELEYVRMRDGTRRVTIKPIEDSLPFDKVCAILPHASVLWYTAVCGGKTFALKQQNSCQDAHELACAGSCCI